MNCSLQARVLPSILTYLRVRFQEGIEPSDSSLLQEEALLFNFSPSFLQLHCPINDLLLQEKQTLGFLFLFSELKMREN